MFKVNAKIFNPEVLYIFDVLTIGPSSGKSHSHDFLEISIIIDGETLYTIDNHTVYLEKETILLFNPGTIHYEQALNNMRNTQLHIGFRNILLDCFPKDFFPVESPIIHLKEHNKEFFIICQKIIAERAANKPGVELMLKALVTQLIVLLLRDSSALMNKIIQETLTADEQKKQQTVNEIIHYLETHYRKDITLNDLARHYFLSSTNLSRIFKEETGDSPINYLIKVRLEQAKLLLDTKTNMSIKEISKLVGYNDALYFSKLFKKHYGQSPSAFMTKM
ncbi:AraC-like ligand binding domain-containing protein [Carnobacterium iners]|uniref:AraC-like ligand binding domain-containing protein n=1 Tax=Carnobacterium iners TaxID=1073423 RepID=A0A1X7N1Y9_9LACT|nr:AraC family transcriptional regulator [Carnobacterium iners]SEK96479.1 AraC-like ligand binding domain-containing protein [Carnobacterium iners]SMH31237.1 AraC-like ligand binding domain-containing protein [Carnobacterium iners]